MATGPRRFFTILIAVLAAAAILVPVGSTESPTPYFQSTLYFMYAMNCTFTIQNDSGQVVNQIPAGSYQIDVRTPTQFGTVSLVGVNDMTACHGFVQFQLTGPGVNFDTTLLSGCGQDQVASETFSPNATYVAQDNNQPSVTRSVFTTSSNVGPPPAPQTTTNSGKPTKSSSPVGSNAIIGTLKATLSAKGKLTLTKKGKPVSKLAAGRYSVVIVDKDPKGSFILQSPKLGSTKTLTGAKFVGHHSTTVKLAAGKWMYYAGLGKMHAFTVIAS